MTVGLLAVVAAVLGLAVGSFVNVVVHRVPAGLSVVSPPSRCPGCEHPVRPRDNVPVVSWLLLRGRCRDCGTRIAARYPLVEAGTAALLVLVTLALGPTWTLPAFWYLAAAGVALALVDVDVHRLPDAIVLPSYPVSAVLLAVGAVADGEPGRLVGAGLGAVLLLAGFWGLWAYYTHVRGKRALGFGDVKLSGLLGLHLGYLGWEQVAVGTFAGFLLGGVLAIGLLAAGRASRATQIPFGPALLAGALLAVLVGDPVAAVWLGR